MKLDPSAWQQLTTSDPGVLAATRLSVHWAAQTASALGTTLAEAKPDTSHTGFVWHRELAALVGERSADRRRLRAGFRPADTTLLLLDSTDDKIDELALAGKTVAETLAWLRAESNRFAGEEIAPELAWFDYDLPPHPAADGAAFDFDGTHTAELGRWFANSDALLGQIADQAEGASPVLCWPHHFDIATLITLEGEGEDAKTIGVGMTPGDATTDPAPYWYVTPWPYPPADAELPALPSGRWHREGWTGAVLTGAETAAGSGDDQANRTAEFLTAAIAACREILGR